MSEVIFLPPPFRLLLPRSQAGREGGEDGRREIVQSSTGQDDTTDSPPSGLASEQATPRGEDRKRGMTARRGREGKEQRPEFNNFLEDGPQHDRVAIDATEMSEMPPHRALSVFSAAKLAPKVVYLLFWGPRFARRTPALSSGETLFFSSPSSRRRLPFFAASSNLVECCCGSAHLLVPSPSSQFAQGVEGIEGDSPRFLGQLQSPYKNCKSVKVRQSLKEDETGPGGGEVTNCRKNPQRERRWAGGRRKKTMQQINRPADKIGTHTPTLLPHRRCEARKKVG